MKRDDVIQKDLIFDKTVSLGAILGKEVISRGGTIIGRVKQIRIDPTDGSVEGIIVKKKIFQRPMYIGKSYLARFSTNAVVLKVDLSILLRGKNVINSHGKVIGKVIDVVRRGHTNDISGIMVRSFWSRKFFVPRSAIHQNGQNVILKNKYNAPKKYFWQRP